MPADRTCLMCPAPGTVGLRAEPQDHLPSAWACDNHAAQRPAWQIISSGSARLVGVIEKGVRSG